MKTIAAGIALLSLLLGSVQELHGQDITVTLLGTGSPTPTVDRFGPSTLIQAGGQTLVFDAGRGVLQRLVQAGVNLGQLDVLFLTHLHSDHIVGIPDLWLTDWFLSGRARPIELFGPPGTARMMDHLKQAFAVDLQVRVEGNTPLVLASGAEVVVRDIEPGVVFDRGGVRVTAIKVDHRAISPAYGYRIDYAGRSVVLSGDTQVSPDLIKAALRTDMLIHEIYEVSEDYVKQNPRRAEIGKTFHVDASQAGTVFQQVRPKLAVYSHIILRGVGIPEVVERTRRTYTGPLVVGEDLMRFVIAQDVAVYRP